MEAFAVIGLDTQEKKAEAESILKELGYRDDTSWNNRFRKFNSFNVISCWESGNYAHHNKVSKTEPPITLDHLRAKVGKTDPMNKLTYPCMMEVWDNGMKPKLRKVIADFYTPKGVKRYVAISADGYSTRPFDSARPIQPDPLKEVVDDMKIQIASERNTGNNRLACWHDSIGVLLTPNEAQLIIDALEKNK